MLVRIPVLLAVVLCSSITQSDNSVEIPLDQIWALDMPGTKEVRKLSTVDANKIHGSLMLRSAERARAGPCFIVTGEGKEALSNAVKVIVDRKAPARTLLAGKNSSLVFYSYAAPGYVHLNSIRRTRSQLKVKYQIVTHRSLGATVHFALIPLGKLSAGQFTIETIEVPSKKPYTNHSRTELAVCDSCTFVVQHEGAKK